MRFSLLFVLLQAACSGPTCTRNSDCGHGFVCGEEDTCVVPPDMTKIDGGAEDGSTDSSVPTDLSIEQDLASFDGDTTD
jgi:hypothetical protein